MHKRIINTDIDKYLSKLDLTQPVHTNPFMVFACMKWLADNSTNACEELATVPYSEDLVALVKKKADAAGSRLQAEANDYGLLDHIPRCLLERTDVQANREDSIQDTHIDILHEAAYKTCTGDHLWPHLCLLEDGSWLAMMLQVTKEGPAAMPAIRFKGPRHPYNTNDILTRSVEECLQCLK